MKQSDDGNRKQSGGAGERPAKKPYQKPEAQHEKVFETSALSCGKSNATEWQCGHSKKNS